MKDPKTGVCFDIKPYPPGCCIMISRKVYEDVGRFDEKRLIRTVDTSYFKQMFNKGYKCGNVDPESVILHTGKEQRTWYLTSGVPILRV